MASSGEKSRGKISPQTKAQALKALDGMAEIVRKERLIKGEYVSDDVDPEFATAICGGRKYCAIGSLWAGAGVHPDVEEREWGTLVDLPGAAQEKRRGFLAPRHGLRTAYVALNAAADRYIKRNKVDEDDIDPYFESSLEGLFEGSSDVGRSELLRIINAAKATLR